MAEEGDGRKAEEGDEFVAADDGFSSFSFNDSTVTKADFCENMESACCCCGFSDERLWWAEAEGGGAKAEEGWCFCKPTPLLLRSVSAPAPVDVELGSPREEKRDLLCCSSCCRSSFRLPMMSEMLLPANPDKFNPL